MFNKRKKVSDKMLLIWLLLAGVIILITPSSITGKLQTAFAEVQRKFIFNRNITLTAVSASDRADDNYIAKRQYELLRNQLANIQEWLAIERQKVEQLAQMRDRPVWKGTQFVIADIIRPFDNSESGLIISRGSDDGIQNGHFVLGDNSVIGTISDVKPRTAQVALITNPDSRIPVRISELNIAGVMHGNTGNSAKLLLMSYKHPIKKGMTVCVQKTPGFIDAPIITGTIAECKRDPENPLFWLIAVEPACNFKNLVNVTIIIMNPQNNN
ncbi:MAG: rod shape-determining protein MreC [Candidatus Brocadiia bacterium]|nr:MAG: rod shape-determining protein MreC [Candidatus Brocadiia bacterium]